MKLALCAGLLFCAALPALAIDTEYTSLAAFQAATSGLTTITFDGMAPSGGFINVSSGLSLSGVTFNMNGSGFIIDYGYYGASSYAGDDFLNSDYAGTDTITALLPAGTMAVGSNYGSLFGSAGETVTLSDGTTYNVPDTSISGGSAGLNFVGFTSSVPITSISFSTNQYIVVDNFTFGSAGAVTPEPGAYAMIASLGLTGAAFLRRRRAH